MSVYAFELNQVVTEQTQNVPQQTAQIVTLACGSQMMMVVTALASAVGAHVAPSEPRMTIGESITLRTSRRTQMIPVTADALKVTGMAMGVMVLVRPAA